MMDRESRRATHRFSVAGKKSDAISGARAGWQGICLPLNLVPGDMTYETYNEETDLYVPAKDQEGSTINPVTVVAGDNIPLSLEVNHFRNWRISMSTDQPQGLTFTTVNKV